MYTLIVPRKDETLIPREIGTFSIQSFQLTIYPQNMHIVQNRSRLPKNIIS